MGTTLGFSQKIHECKFINMSMASNEVNAENSNTSGSEDTLLILTLQLTLWFCWSELNMLMADRLNKKY